ncbi:MAG: glycosyltransferase family 2 protein [Candidatus Nomurabacteria bacterium]|nr:glycosyltransferase family 2 protein [Candidatus Nomurabacteria bacterium]
MTITAIILNYKNYQDTKECILSLKKQILGKDMILRVLIIDNGSEDNNTRKLQEEFPEHEYIYNDKNLGFAKGINQGILLSVKHSDYFLLLNNDALLDQSSLIEMVAVSEEKSIVGPVIFYKNSPEIVWQGGGFFSKLIMNVVVPDKNKKPHFRKSLYVDFLSGCTLLIPKNVIENIGYFDERFFFYGEDLDFSLRAKKAKIKLIYHRSARAWHNIQNIEQSRTSPFVLENLAFSYIMIVKKHYPNFKIYGLILFIFIYTPFRLYQIIKGGNSLKNIIFWIKGGIKAWKTKI